MAQTATGDGLPDAPSLPAKAVNEPVAPKFTKYIASDEGAVPLSTVDKIHFGFRDAYSLSSLEVWTLAAGWETLVNNPPNYGQDPAGFGKRLGAAALRDPSESILVDSVFAPIFHEDPRYYKLGPQRPFKTRAFYAITRPFITRKDDGGAAPNNALLAGDLSATILTNAYYPQQNRGFSETAKGFGGSLGAIALGNAFQEFKDDGLDWWKARREWKGVHE